MNQRHNIPPFVLRIDEEVVISPLHFVISLVALTTFTGLMHVESSAFPVTVPSVLLLHSPMAARTRDKQNNG
jgi:hypothetical protein